MAEATTYGIVEAYSASHSFPIHGCKGSMWLDGIGKVRRRCRFGQNLPQNCLSVFSPKTLPLLDTRLKKHPATETSD
ncbi:hypothetical protein M1B78_17400 [Bacteroides sp. KH569_7]|uniref:Uncharacterized protein n=1 Tax=Bacteroides muris (ex Fokt et al. 2023) TaxID=2937417 RepID=A0A9X2P4M7_9BACE|nr:hypothetical protein [Bacteroides muris (ex Fokt et al. 2023)]MCR6509876.1 hypothetical protein [Bacteroides muris (ex Fokt et al. 2023)]